MTSLKTSIKTITYLSDIGCLEIQGASLRMTGTSCNFARKKNPSLPEFWYARAVTYEVNGVEKTVLTSLPADRYKAKEVEELYHSRWEIEVGFRNLKSSMLNNALVLRSRKVEQTYL